MDHLSEATEAHDHRESDRLMDFAIQRHTSALEQQLQIY